VSAAFGEPFVNAHVPVRFSTISRLASYGFKCEWVSTTGTYFVDLDIWPPPGGQKLYYAATHIPAGYEVSPRPSTTVLDGVPGDAVALPGEIEFITPQGLVAVIEGSHVAQVPRDSVARTLARVAAANLAKLHPA
jgi:hypothetical protein